MNSFKNELLMYYFVTFKILDIINMDKIKLSINFSISNLVLIVFKCTV